MDVRSILDIGCGNGNLAKRLSEKGYVVMGCDPEESAIRIAENNAKNVVFKVLGVYDDPLELGSHPFDTVVACEVIEHLFLPRALPTFAHKVLKRSGYFIITTPHYGSYSKNLISSFLNKWDDHFTTLWDGGHVKFWSLNTLQAILDEAGFDIVSHYTVNRISRLLRFIWPNNIVIIAQKK